MAIRDLPILLRPREKAIRYGYEALSDQELLAIIINSGNKEHDALDIANALLTYAHGLRNICRISQKELKNINGISKVKAIQLGALFTLFDRISKHVDEEEIIVDNDYIFNRFKYTLAYQEQEQLVVLVCGRKRKIIYETALYKGTNAEVPFSIKEILRIVIGHGGSSFYLIHNHPNGTLEPSREDEILTMRCRYEALRIGLHLLDHLIITRSGYTSISESISKRKQKCNK